jgi:hypothetical protein
MAEPIFSKVDDPNKTKLPPELVGKSAEEIYAYHQRQMQIVTERSRQRPPAPPAKKEDPPEEKIDVFGNDVAGSVKRIAKREVEEVGEQFVHTVAPGIILGCKAALRERFPEYYGDFIAETEELMGRMVPANQMNPVQWEIAFRQVMSQNMSTIVSKAEQRGKDSMKPANPVERPTGPGTPPDKPRELSAEEKQTADRFGLSHADYLKAADRYDQTEGLLPMTYDSKKAKKKAS